MQGFRLLSTSGILGYGFTVYDAANAFRATLPRLVPAGDGDTDVYGAQQHTPLLDVEIPL